MEGKDLLNFMKEGGTQERNRLRGLVKEHTPAGMARDVAESDTVGLDKGAKLAAAALAATADVRQQRKGKTEAQAVWAGVQEQTRDAQGKGPVNIPIPSRQVTFHDSFAEGAEHGLVGRVAGGPYETVTNPSIPWPAPVFSHQATVSDAGLEYGLIDSNSGKPQISPKVALLLRAGTGAVLTTHARAVSAITHWKGNKPGISADSVRALGHLVENSEVVLWRPSMWDTAISGMEAFIGTKLEPDDVRTHNQFWVWESGGKVYSPEHPMGMTFELDVTCGLQSIILVPCIADEDHRKGGTVNTLWQDIKAFTAVLVFSPVTHEDNPLLADVLPRLRFLSPCVAGEEVAASHAAIMAARKFMELPFVVKEPMKEPMHRVKRRQMEREGIPIPEVMTIALRRKERTEHPRTGGEHAHRNWSCQWMVGWPLGRWRKQWYPSEGVHKPKWIAPYAKGPTDKPMKAPRDSVYVVRR